MKKVQSTCNYCAIDCNLDFYVEDNKIIKIVPTKGYPVNDGFSCVKGISLDKQHSKFKPNPLPRLKRKDGSFEYVSWEKGFEEVAQRITEIREKYGNESVAALSTGQMTMEEFAIFGHMMRNHLKANVDGNTRLCMATAAVAHKQSFGFDAPGYTLKDLELSDTIIFIGANPVVAHPILWGRVRKNRNKKVIVIDPRYSETAKNADYWYGIKSKTDLTLFYTLANLIIKKDYINRDYIEDNTENFQEFKEFVKDYTLEKAVETCGITREQIEELVELIHDGERVSFWWTMGINQGHEAVRSVQAIINLALMTGNIGREGTGANSITGQSNAMGSRVFSNTTGLFGGGDFDNPNRRKNVAKALGVEESLLIEKPTIPYNKIIENINSGEIKALWVVCTNPRHSWINNETFREAMEKLEVLIVQDIYDDTETSSLCDIYLPAVPGIKKEGTVINLERRLSAVRPCLEKDRDELTDYEIFYGVAKALKLQDIIERWKTPKDAFNFMRACSEGMPCDITGIEYEDLEESHGIQWPLRAGEKLVEDERRLYEDGKYFTPSKKAKFLFEKVAETPLKVSEEYPYIFNTGRGTVGQWHTQSRTREIPFVIDAVSKEAYIYINPDLAKEKGIQENDTVVVRSSNGQSAEFIAMLSSDVRREELYAPIHYIECNKLTSSVYDAYSKEPSYKAAVVNIFLKGE
jgi:predicted molibdopterin-dependent oxidoreductase YjgC